MTVSAAVAPVAALRDVHFAYQRPGRDPLPVLGGVDVAVAPGEMVALLAAARRPSCDSSAGP